MTTVRTLRVNDNDVSSVDMSNFPKLRTLYADGNRIARLSRSGFETSRLENLSLRNQRCSQLRLSRAELSPVKRLYVSGKLLDRDNAFKLIIRQRVTFRLLYEPASKPAIPRSCCLLPDSSTYRHVAHTSQSEGPKSQLQLLHLASGIVQYGQLAETDCRRMQTWRKGKGAREMPKGSVPFGRT